MNGTLATSTSIPSSSASDSHKDLVYALVEDAIQKSVLVKLGRREALGKALQAGLTSQTMDTAMASSLADLEARDRALDLLKVAIFAIAEERASASTGTGAEGQGGGEEHE